MAGEKERVKEWIEEKLEDGADEQKIREVLDGKGYNPSLVDEVKTPQVKPLHESTDTISEEDSGRNYGGRIKDSGGKLLQGLKRSGKPVLVILILVAAVAGIGFLYSSSNINLPSTDSDYTEPEIEGEEVKVVLMDRLAKPSRPTISEGDGVRFANNASHAFNITFDREVESFVLDKGETRLVDIKSVVYYTAEPVGTDARKVHGSVSVQ